MLLIGTIARILLASMWLSASASKARRLDSIVGTVETLSPVRGVPARTLAIGLLVLEAATGLLFFSSATLRIASCLSIALLLSFTVVVAIALAKGLRVQCNCFGQIGDKPISKRTLLRNVGLLLVSVFSLMPTLQFPGGPTSVVQQPDWVLSFILSASIVITLLVISSVMELADRIFFAEDGPTEHLPEVRWLRTRLNRQA